MFTPVPAEVVEAGSRIMAEGCKLEMIELAENLGIGRTTLYRWAGDRERVIASILRAGVDTILSEADLGANGHGVERVVDVVERVMRGAQHAEGFQHFLRNEPHLGLRLVTTGDAVHGRVVAFFEGIIARERRFQSFPPGLDDRTLAYAIVRLAESFLYSRAIAGAEPDIDRGLEVIRALLGLPPAGQPVAKQTGGRREDDPTVVELR